jgi:hypothetical protein
MNFSRSFEPIVGKLMVVAVMLTAFMVFSGVRTEGADRYASCQRQTAKADHRLHEAIEHHGYRSEQAAHARHNLAEVREHCWGTYHRWWDEDERRWHTERDWRDEDHEHYRDR